MSDKSFKALLVSEATDGKFKREIVQRNISELPAGEVLVRVKYTALNYKDALSASGNKGVTRKFPHTPGIDASGVIEHSEVSSFSAGDEVIVTSYDLGMNTSGGFAEYIRVPAGWVVPKPETLSLKDSMIMGTAGFTAALALYKMERIGQSSEMGPILVTGASGGVGSMAVAILARKGYDVIASSGSEDAYPYLKKLGAKECVSRDDVIDESNRPLMRGNWAGAIDTVGGFTLTTLLKGCKREGSVASCGLVGSPKLPGTVYPFILNGVNLLGVDSANCTMPLRKRVWDTLANDWKISQLDDIATVCNLEELNGYISQMLEGNTRGRIVAKL